MYALAHTVAADTVTPAAIATIGAVLFNSKYMTTNSPTPTESQPVIIPPKKLMNTIVYSSFFDKSRRSDR
ncbi:hypothetical protein TUM4261_18850 [Shewanella sp. c952]|nr:hypothetical protein TUM4261_18850 [Shewanella sp. c952]